MKYEALTKNGWKAVALGAVGLAPVARGQDILKPSPVMTALSATTISGYVDTSAVWNPGTGNANSPAYAFGGGPPNATKSDGFNLNVVKLVIEKDPELATWFSAGYKVDLLFGPDAVAYGTQPFGTPASGMAVKQAYIDLRAPIFNGVEIKMGVWDTILGYEVFETPLNPNFTKSYGYTIEPATFTGVQATYNFNEYLAVTAGVADTLGSSIDARAFPPQGTRAESYKAYLGDVSLTAPGNWKWLAGSTLLAAVVTGYDPISVTGGAANQTSLYVGGNINTPLKALTFGGAFDYAGLSKRPAGAGSYANAVGFYAHYQATDKLQLNSRVEWFTQSPSLAAPGLPSKAMALTETVQYNIWDNVITRAEVRFDHQADGLADAFGGTTAGVGARRNSVALIANVIYKF
jgi:hypothetical protein